MANIISVENEANYEFASLTPPPGHLPIMDSNPKLPFNSKQLPDHVHRVEFKLAMPAISPPPQLSGEFDFDWYADADGESSSGATPDAPEDDPLVTCLSPNNNEMRPRRSKPAKRVSFADECGRQLATTHIFSDSSAPCAFSSPSRFSCSLRDCESESTMNHILIKLIVHVVAKTSHRVCFSSYPVFCVMS